MLEKRYQFVIDTEALKLVARLHERYATYSSPPGRPLRFFDQIARDASGGVVTASEVTRGFSEGSPPRRG